jgi:hypothetical protein
MVRRECAPARSVDLITAEMSEAFPPAGNLVLAAVVSTVEVDSMGAAASMAAVGDAGDCMYVRDLQKVQYWRGLRCCETFRFRFNPDGESLFGFLR